VYPYIAFLALFQAPAPQVGIPLVEDCSESAPVLATLSRSAPAEVRSSVAGYAKTCYAVTAEMNGKSVKGYVLGDGLDAVAEFERQRAAVAASIADVAPAPVAAPAAAPVAKAPPVEKPHYPPFRDFSALDMKGKAVSAHSLKGKVNLVVFWSPTHAVSSRELLLAVRLYGQFQKQGMDALAVSLSGNTPQLKDTLEDYQLRFRSVPNGRDIADGYGIDYENLPRTYVLNENFEVIASGLHGKALEELVNKLVAEK
jgi:peroxiredoxin